MGLAEVSDDNMRVRYHFVIVDNKGREQIRDGIFNQIQKAGMAVELLRETEGSVRDSRLKYLLVTFDTYLAPREIDWTKIRLPKVPDDRLYERKKKGTSLEAYVMGLYS